MQFFMTPEMLWERLLVYWICKYVVMPTNRPMMPARSELAKRIHTDVDVEEIHWGQFRAMLPNHGKFIVYLRVTFAWMREEAYD